MRRLVSIFAAVLFALSVAVVSAGPSVEGWGVPLTINRKPTFQITAPGSTGILGGFVFQDSGTTTAGHINFKVCTSTNSCNFAGGLVPSMWFEYATRLIMYPGVLHGYADMTLGNYSAGNIILGSTNTNDINLNPKSAKDVNMPDLTRFDGSAIRHQTTGVMGWLPPQFNGVLLDPTDGEGYIGYRLDTHSLQFNTGAAWVDVFSSDDTVPVANGGTGLTAGGSAGQVLTMVGAAPAWAAPSVSDAASWATRHLAWWIPNQTNANALTAWGGGALTSEQATAVGDATLTTRMMIKYTTVATIGSQGGVDSNSMTEWQYQPRTVATIRTGASVAVARIIHGPVQAPITAQVCTTAGGGSNFARGAYLCYDTSGTPADAWMCCAANGTNFSCTTTGVAVTADTNYTLEVDGRPGTSIVCKVNSTSVTHGTTVPGSSTATFGPLTKIRTLEDVAKVLAIGQVILESN